MKLNRHVLLRKRIMNEPPLTQITTLPSLTAQSQTCERCLPWYSLLSCFQSRSHSSRFDCRCCRVCRLQCQDADMKVSSPLVVHPDIFWEGYLSPPALHFRCTSSNSTWTCIILISDSPTLHRKMRSLHPALRLTHTHTRQPCAARKRTEIKLKLPKHHEATHVIQEQQDPNGVHRL